MAKQKCTFRALLCLLFSAWLVNGFQFDKDTLDENECLQQAALGQCIADEVTFFRCASSCTAHYLTENSYTHGAVKDPDAFYELSAMTKSPATGKTHLTTFDRFEGYVVVVLTLPLFRGMAKYYTHMLEHLHTVFPFTIEIIVFPIRRADDESSASVKLEPNPKSKVLFAKELIKGGDRIESHPVLEYLEKAVDPSSEGILTDRVTAYLVSFSAKVVDKRVSPSMELLETMGSHYLKEMQLKPEL